MAKHRTWKKHGSLWQRKVTRNGKETEEDFLVGEMKDGYGGVVRITLYFNKKKSTPKAPDWTLYVARKGGAREKKGD